MCYVTFVNSLPYKAMRRLGKHTTYEFQTHIELDAPSVMCSFTLYYISVQTKGIQIEKKFASPPKNAAYACMYCV